MEDRAARARSILAGWGFRPGRSRRDLDDAAQDAALSIIEDPAVCPTLAARRAAERSARAARRFPEPLGGRDFAHPDTRPDATAAAAELLARLWPLVPAYVRAPAGTRARSRALLSIRRVIR